MEQSVKGSPKDFLGDEILRKFRGINDFWNDKTFSTSKLNTVIFPNPNLPNLW